MANRMFIVRPEQVGNHARLLAELKAAHRLGLKYGVETLAMRELLISCDALGTWRTLPAADKMESGERRKWKPSDPSGETTTDEFMEAHGWSPTKANQMAAGEALRMMGYTKVRRMASGVRRWVYVA